LTEHEKAIAAARAEFDQTCRSADEAYLTSDCGPEAARAWNETVSRAQESVRAAGEVGAWAYGAQQPEAQTQLEAGA
jgi:hypothetical protein